MQAKLAIIAAVLLSTTATYELSTMNEANAAQSQSAGIYTYTAKALDGKDIKLSDYRGKVLLVVNTASACGFTPQYAELEKLHEKYSGEGLVVLGFPCNQFGHQEPGSSGDIANFCQKNYGVQFQMFDKIDVNGKDTHPLYKFLKENAPGVLGSEGIKWNFTKFLIDKNGHVVKRYAPSVKPLEIADDIEKELKAK
jgi:glutathione peroxidase